MKCSFCRKKATVYLPDNKTGKPLKYFCPGHSRKFLFAGKTNFLPRIEE